VPFIYEDYVSCETISDGIMKLYKKSDQERKELKEKVLNYAETEFSYENTIDAWHQTLSDLSTNWRDNHITWECIEI
jgi:hypothetical protein